MKKIEASKSAEKVASIDDLLIQVLVCLPIRSLNRLKFVSKHWLSIITNNYFRHLRYNNANPAIAICCLSPESRWSVRPDIRPPDIRPPDIRPRIYYFPFSASDSKLPRFARADAHLKFMHSCNGLLLGPNFTVYNPTTGKFSYTIPELNYVRYVNLVFDPIKSPHFKLVCIRRVIGGFWHERRRWQIWIYSSDMIGYWKASTELKLEYETFDFRKGVYWNGAIHWISRHGPPHDNALVFKVDDEELDTMPMPNIHSCHYFYFGESCDHLHYVGISKNPNQFDVYEMKRDYSEWFVKYQVDLSEFFYGKRWPFWGLSILCVIRGLREEDSFLLLDVEWGTIRYNLVSKTFEKLNKIASCTGKNWFQHIELLC